MITGYFLAEVSEYICASPSYDYLKKQWNFTLNKVRCNGEQNS